MRRLIFVSIELFECRVSEWDGDSMEREGRNLKTLGFFWLVVLEKFGLGMWANQRRSSQSPRSMEMIR